MSKDRIICEISGFGDSSSSSSSMCSGLVVLFNKVGVSPLSKSSLEASLLFRAKARHFRFKSGIKLSCLEPKMG